LFFSFFASLARVFKTSIIEVQILEIENSAGQKAALELTAEV
jgi:hypothetical protein